jgi:hypothetical protein
MLPKVFFYETAFVKFKNCNNFELTSDETDLEQQKIYRKIHTRLWILKLLKFREPKASRLFPNLCDFQKNPYS